MEQVIKDALQIGFSFFVAVYLLVVMTNLIRELREQFVGLKAAIEQMATEVREMRRELQQSRERGSPHQ